jgi:peptidoglycan/xylan/chitin deacetylase (PgdA/CDA1 family)
MKKKPRIYMLHRVIEHYDEDNYYFQRKTAISWNKFIELLDLIEMNGWQAKPISSITMGFTDQDVFITFDDGYEDNCKALDELIRRGMTATVFPVKDFSLTGFSPIDDMSQHVMASTTINANLLQSLLGGRIKKILRGMSASRYRYYRKHWFSIVIDADNSDLFMSEEQLRHYCDHGIELGIHGRSHRAFIHLSSSELKYELVDSFNWLKLLGNISVASICFPHGKHNEQVIKLSQSVSQILLGVDCDTLESAVLRRIHVTEDYDV